MTFHAKLLRSQWNLLESRTRVEVGLGTMGRFQHGPYNTKICIMCSIGLDI